MATKIRSVLIANRGEIALRIIQTCKILGITSYAIYAEDDRELPFVEEADVSVLLEGDSVTNTYLNIELIVNIAKKYQIDAIHPGYGFLSENTLFAKKVKSEGIEFLGPNEDTIELMGDKKEAKQYAEKIGMPLIPGYHGEEQDKDFLYDQAKKIGFPLLIKATAGGGGKGMKIVYKASDFYGQLELAKSEAMKSFSDDHVILEKFIEKPRHIEVQVFGDGQGNAVHLYERECSIQRRYQKIIEETPSIALSDSVRKSICDSAVKLAKETNYLGAGTVEFIMDPNLDFYFLEMNTRLQVEHPISEELTGVDLVAWQIKIAEEKKLFCKQEDIPSRGHAIECRVYAEDPDNGFLPTIGKVGYTGQSRMKQTRVDLAIQDGNTIGLNYDPMIGKLISYGNNRKEAIEKMIILLEDYPFLGIKTNRDFLIRILKNPAFVSGNYDTNWVQKNIDLINNFENTDDEKNLALAINQIVYKNISSKTDESGRIEDPWDLVSL